MSAVCACPLAPSPASRIPAKRDGPVWCFEVAMTRMIVLAAIERAAGGYQVEITPVAGGTPVLTMHFPELPDAISVIGQSSTDHRCSSKISPSVVIAARPESAVPARVLLKCLRGKFNLPRSFGENAGLCGGWTERDPKCFRTSSLLRERTSGSLNTYATNSRAAVVLLMQSNFPSLRMTDIAAPSLAKHHVPTPAASHRPVPNIVRPSVRNHVVSLRPPTIQRN
jgi:hypothetical protein